MGYCMVTSIRCGFFLFSFFFCALSFSDHPINPKVLLSTFLPSPTQEVHLEDVKVTGSKMLRPTSAQVKSLRWPIVVVPSLVGNQLQMKLEHKKDPNLPWYCFRNADWYNVWLNQEEFYPYLVNCWVENMRLDYNTTTKMNQEPQGTFVRAPFWGTIQGIEYLDEAHTVPVWTNVTKILRENGYTDGVDMVAAPYDWRLGPYDLISEYFPQLKSLIERTYVRNSNTPVAVLSLSMGGPVFLSFLNQYVDQAWKDQYIRLFLSFSGAFGGSSWAIESLLTGLVGYTPTPLPFVRMWGSTTRNLPLTQIFGDDRPIVRTPRNKYMLGNLTSLLFLADPLLSRMYQDMLPTMYISAPGVETHCMFGYGLPTLDQLQFLTDSFSGPFTNTTSDGDGTLLTPDGWVAQQSQPVFSYKLKGMPHAMEIHLEVTLNLMKKILGLK